MVFRKARVPVSPKVLEQLISSNNSCTEVVKLERDISTLPYHGNNWANAIKEQLNELIGRCIKEVNGIVLGYKNIKILTETGLINDGGCINFPILVDFFVFKPVPGKELSAVVTKRSKDHIGCLVYQTFNVSIPKPEEALKWQGNSVEIGQEISVRVTKVKLDSNIPYIRGEFLEKNTLNKKIKFNDSDNTILDSEIIKDGVAPLVDESIKKKRKKSRNSLESENLNCDNTILDSENIEDGAAPSVNESIKKKRKKSFNSLENENVNSDNAILDSENKEDGVAPLINESIKKKRKKSSNSLENENVNSDNTILDSENIEDEVAPLDDEPIKKKRKKSSNSLENENVDCGNTILDSENIDSPLVDKPLKKKRSRNSLENGNVDVDIDEPKPKKKKKNKDYSDTVD